MSFTPYQIVPHQDIAGKWRLEVKNPRTTVRESMDRDELVSLWHSLESDLDEITNDDLDAASAIYKKETGN